MKAQEIRELSLGDLEDKITIETEAFSKLKMTHAISELENPMQIREKRRLIARLNTELSTRRKAENA